MHYQRAMALNSNDADGAAIWVVCLLTWVDFRKLSTGTRELFG